MRKMNEKKGITLVALVVTIIVLLILAGIVVVMVIGENGIIARAGESAEITRRENAREKVILMLGEYALDRQKEEKTLTQFFEEKLEEGRIDAIVEDADTYIIIEVDGYEFTIDKDTLQIIGDPVKVGGVKPIIEVQVTKVDGSILEGGELEKALTVNIVNIAEFGSDYTIGVKDEEENEIQRYDQVVGNLTGLASFFIEKSGTYTITVTGTKDGITKTVSKKQKIEMSMATTTTQFSKKYGVIDIIWLDTNNQVINTPMSPASYLSGLTAIKHDGTDWAVADTTNTGNDWYNYVAQTGKEDGKSSKWANARTSDGNAYFVWIPRYAYKITYFDTQTNADAYRTNPESTTGIIGYSSIEGMIDVGSGKEKLVEGTVPINVTGTVQNKDYAEYIPHPAFEFDGAKAGIWVGKYESSEKEIPGSIVIKPNTNGSGKKTVSEIFEACQNIKTTYGLTADSHMMKNTEWGACAYLADSRYGRNGTEVTINHSYYSAERDYITNVIESTTGNVYGVYDMSGGTIEYVAGYINNSEVQTSGYFTNLLNAVAQNSKYADVYPIVTDTVLDNYENNKGMKGDAVYETTYSAGGTGWYDDSSYFPTTTTPVFTRGLRTQPWCQCWNICYCYFCWKFEYYELSCSTYEIK